MADYELLRTPEERFADLKDYPFDPNYVDVDGIRMHFIDEGPRDSKPILLLHGEPSWSYLYRHMINKLVSDGFRCIAPDIIGFGKSDKLINPNDYTYQKHADWMVEFIRKLNLNNITLFCQDWGGLIGLRCLEQEGDRFERVIAANTALPAAKGWKGRYGYFLFKMKLRFTKIPSANGLASNPSFVRWVKLSQTAKEFRIGRVVQGGTIKKLTHQEINAYDAPFPDESYKAGARRFPILVPSQLRKNQQVWDEVLSKWEKPFHTAFSDKDQITRGGETRFMKKIPGARNAKHIKIENASHFLQEDKASELADFIIEVVES